MGGQADIGIEYVITRSLPLSVSISLQRKEDPTRIGCLWRVGLGHLLLPSDPVSCGVPSAGCSFQISPIEKGKECHLRRMGAGVLFSGEAVSLRGLQFCFVFPLVLIQRVPARSKAVGRAAWGCSMNILSCHGSQLCK